jgi:hypothetical protein
MNWVCRTLPGNIVLTLIVFGIPEFLILLRLSYLQGILSVDRACDVLLKDIPVSIVGGVLIWFLVTRPMLRKWGKR